MQPPEPADFLYLFEDDEDITEKQALDYLESLMTVLQGFVDLGFSIDSVHNCLPHNILESTRNPANAVKSKGARTPFETAALVAAESEE